MSPKIGLLSLALLLMPCFLTAQNNRQFPVVDVTTNVSTWLEQTASISAQITPLPWLGALIGVSYKPQQISTERFIKESQSFEIQSEARLFLFGPPRQIFQKDVRPAFWKKPKAGCKASWCFGTAPQNGVKKFLAGVYIAPGFDFHRQDAVFIPKSELNSTIPAFRYRIVNQGPTLTAGYQTRFRRLSFGVGAGLKFSQPKWSGPHEVFKDNIYSVTFPERLRIENYFRLELGVNF